MEKPGRLQSMGSQRVGHDWVTRQTDRHGVSLIRWLIVSTFQCPFMPQLGDGPGGDLGFKHEWAPWPSLLHLKHGLGGLLSLLVDGGLKPCRAVAKRWYMAWSHRTFSNFACSSQLLKILKAKFKRSHWGFEGLLLPFLVSFGYLGVTGR